MTADDRRSDGGRRDDAVYDVTLVRADGREEHIPVRAGESIVDAAERADVAVPYGCRYGVCATCTARLLGGDVVHVRPVRGLKDDALEEGYVLPCIATPESDCRLRIGHEIQAEVLGTPWK